MRMIPVGRPLSVANLHMLIIGVMPMAPNKEGDLVILAFKGK